MDKSQIEFIRTSFAKMQSKEDFLRLLNKVKRIIYGQKAIDFKLNQLTWYANPELGGKRYVEFEIKKKSGSSRKIHAPVNGLKALQSVISVILQCVYEPTKVVSGFVLGRSIYDNANWHVGSNYVYNVDLKDFFPSIDQARVWKTIQLKPFNLSGRLEIANVIASIACTSIEVERKDEFGNWQIVNRNVLPQGAPTSPVLTNIVCQKLDYLLTAVANRFGVRYSRYADDITFSSMHNVYQDESEFVKELKRVIESQNFHIKESKTRLQRQGYRMEVTGLLVNDKVNVQKRYVKQLRMWLYYWERYGYERANEYFVEHYLKDKGYVKSNLPAMASVIAGKLDFMKMVVGVESKIYQNLKLRFEKLSGKFSAESELIKEIEKFIIENTNTTLLEKSVLDKKISSANAESMQASTNVNSMGFQIPVIHRPKELVNLLNNFSANNHPLKYACHSWEDGKVEDHFENYSDFIKKYEEFGKPVCFEIQKIKKQLGTKILHFLNTPNENGKYLKEKKFVDYRWGEFGMKYGWQSKELTSWAAENPESDPFDYPLAVKRIISKGNQDIEISKFRDVISLFKSEIEFRPEKADLLNLFIELRRKYLVRDFKVELSKSLEGKQFYTDVHGFKRALNKIFGEISKRTLYPGVLVSANNLPEEGVTFIEITHCESFCEGKSSIEMSKEIYDGDFADILELLKNLCDWSVESKFSDGNFRINYLSSSNSDSAVIPIDSAQGFKHIFKFYKS